MSGDKFDKETLEQAPEAVQGAVSGVVQDVAPAGQSYVDTISEKAHNFIRNNYTEEQRSEIYKSLQQDGEGNVYWQDGKDFVKLSLDEQGRLRKGVMRDAHDDGTYKEFKFGAKDTSLRYGQREIQNDVGLVKEGVKVKKNDEGTVIKKRSSKSAMSLTEGAKQVDKTQVKVNADGQVVDAYISSSQTQGQVLSGNFQYGKETVHVSYGSDGKPVEVSDKTKNVGISAVEGKASVSSSSARAVYGEDGKVDTVDVKSSEVHVDGKEIGGSYAKSSTTYQDNGDVHHVESAYSGGYAYTGSVHANVHYATQNTTVTNVGTEVSANSRDVGLAFGSGGTGVHYAAEKTFTDASGNQQSSGKNVDLAYSLADGTVDLNYAKNNKEVTNGVTQASESKLGFTAGSGKVNVAAFSSNTSTDEHGNETTTKKGLMAGIDTREKKASYASYTSSGEKSYSAQLQTEGAMGFTAGQTITKIDDNGGKTTTTKEASFGFTQDENGTSRVTAMTSNSSIDANGQESVTKNGAEFGVNSNTVRMTRYKNNDTTVHQASFSTEGELGASASSTTTTHTEDGKEQVKATKIEAGFHNDESGFGATALKTKTVSDENGGTVTQQGVAADVNKETLTANAARHGKNSSTTYEAGVNTEDSYGATASRTTTRHTENGDASSTTEVKAGFYKDESGLSAAALKTKTVSDENGETVTQQGVAADVNKETLTANAVRHGKNSSTTYEAGVNTEDGYVATASRTTTQHTESGNTTSTTEVQAGYHNDESGLSAATLKTKTTVDENGEAQVRKYGIEAGVNTEDLSVSTGRYGAKSSNVYEVNVNTEDGYTATATKTSTKYTADDTEQTQTTELQAGVSKNGNNYTAVAQQTQTNTDANGNEQVVQRGGQAHVNVDDKTADATWQASNNTTDYRANVNGTDLSATKEKTTVGEDGQAVTSTYVASGDLKEAGQTVAQGVLGGRSASEIYHETKAAFKVETKLPRNIQNDAKAAGVDISGAVVAQQKFEDAVDAREVAAKEKAKTEQNTAVALVAQKNAASRV